MLSGKDIAELQKDDGSLDDRLSAHREDEEHLRSSVEAAFDDAKGKAGDESDLEAVHPYLDKLEQQYPNRDPLAMLEEALPIAGKLAADPAQGSRELLEWSSSLQRFGDDPKPEELKGAYGMVGVKMRDGRVEYAHEGSTRHSLLLSQAKAEKAAVRSERLGTLQAKYLTYNPGAKFSDGVRTVSDYINAASKDPMYSAARATAASLPPSVESRAQTRATQSAIAARLIKSDPRYKSLKGRDQDMLEAVRSGDVTLTDDVPGSLHNLVTVIQAKDRAAAEIAEFKKTHPDFEAVKGQMAKLVSSGQASGLHDAYLQLKRATVLPKGSDVRADLVRAKAKSRL
jgi:hypothetical protein